MNTTEDFTPVYAFSTGRNHAPFLRPVIQSILKNCTGPKPHFCILLPPGQTQIDIGYDCTVRIISDDDFRLCEKNYFQEGRADIPPFAAYSQLMIPRYFPSFSKILFLEVDQVVQHDLLPLWQLIYSKDIKLGAVRSLDGKTGLLNHKVSDEFFASSYPNSKYYNMGVFLFDTQYWISDNLEKRCMSFVAKQIESQGHSYKFYAQGAMNCALHDDITDMDSIYNWTSLGFRNDIPSDLLDKAAILHWSGPLKPWHENGLYKKYYLKETGLTLPELQRLQEQSNSLSQSNLSKKNKLALPRAFKKKIKRMLESIKT